MNIPDVLPSENPFSNPSQLPLETPEFDRYRPEHFLPAIRVGMQQQLVQVESIAAGIESPTFENTVDPLERSGELLNRVLSAFHALTSAHTNDQLQALQKELAPLLAAHHDNILLNPGLFARLSTVLQQQDVSGLNVERRQVLKHYYDAAVRAGASLPEEKQMRIRSLNERLSTLQTTFEDNLLEEMKVRSVIVTDPAQLAGLSDDEICSARQSAAARGVPDGWLLEISNTTRVPLLASLQKRDLREQVWRASAERALGQGGGIDNRDIVLEISALRAEKAALLGFGNYAEYALADQMAETPQAALKMLTDLIPGVVSKVNKEATELQTMMETDGIHDDVQAWDWEYYAERVRSEKFDVDEAAIRQYFELEQVLQKGVFGTMARLFGITFQERSDLPVYHPDVRTFDVLDVDGAALGLFYFDPFKRDSKRGGAWMDAFVEQSGLLNRRPVIVNVLNIPRPADDQPALVSFDNVVTLFHEMGHAVHGLFSDVTYPSVAGTATPRDFVEFPSTFQEDWAIQSEILGDYAVNQKTGERLPDELLRKVIAASKFNQGYETLEYLAAAILDLEWHLLSTEQIPKDMQAFEAEILENHGIDLPAVPPRYRTAFFAHIWGGGYSASYYAYIWSEVLAADAFAFMIEQGGATTDVGMRLRSEVLSRGSSRPPMDSYRAFRGQEPTVDALLSRRGLND